MNQFTKSDKAETPIAVMFTILVSIIVLTLLEFTAGSITDGFISAINTIHYTLSPWGQGILTPYISRMTMMIYTIPVILTIVIIVWGYRAIFRKQQQIRTETGIGVEEE